MPAEFSESSTRRRFLAKTTFGVGSVALAWLLKEDRLLAEPEKPELEPKKFDTTPKAADAAPRARAMISLFMQGGPSHVDLTDPKPELTRYSGTKFKGDIKYDNAAEASATLLGSPWKFAGTAAAARSCPSFCRIRPTSSMTFA